MSSELFQPIQWLSCLHFRVSCLLFSVTFCLLLFLYVSENPPKLVPPSFKTPTSIVPNGKQNLTTILLWFDVFGKHTDLGDCSSLFGIDGCRITQDRSLYDVADGVLIHHRDINSNLSNLPQVPRPFFQKWVWMNFESPSNAPRIDAIKDLFNLTMNYRRDADITVHERLVLTDKPELFQVPKKSLLVCWIVSNWNPEHQRVKYYMELKQHINISVFGGHVKPLSNEEYITTMTSCKFYLSFENSIHMDYITEKLYKPLLLGAVPVVLGPPKERYENIVPKDAFIHIKDFSSAKELADRLHFLDQNEKEYNSYFNWRRSFKVKGVNFPVEHACQACDYIRKHHKEYPAFHGLTEWYWG